MMQVGAQLYTLRDYIKTETDIRRSLKMVADMGYKTIQVSAMGKIDPHVLREICDNLGLKIVLTHNDPNRILNDTDALIAEHNILGCDYIGLGGMPGQYRMVDWVDRFAEDFKEPAKKMQAAGKLFMYHNHSFEFEKFNGKNLMEILLDAFAPDEMGFTLDTYWIQNAGADVVQWVEILKDRIPCVHLKDMAVKGNDSIMAPVMEGNINFPAILKKLDELGCTKYLLVEQDVCQTSPFQCLQTSYNNLAKLGYK